MEFTITSTININAKDQDDADDRLRNDAQIMHDLKRNAQIDADVENPASEIDA